jgi:hypothetical protein
MSAVFLKLVDLSDPPQVRVDHAPLRLGDRLSLRFSLERMHQGRRELLDVDGEFHVTALLNKLSPNVDQQIAEIAATGKAPSWRAVKLLPARELGPARWPRTPIE